MSDEQDRFDLAVRDAELIKARLAELDPSGGYPLLTKRELGLSESAPVEEHFEHWRDYLAARFQTITERQAFRERLREPTLPDLDSVVDATRSNPEALAELHQAQFEARQA